MTRLALGLVLAQSADIATTAYGLHLTLGIIELNPLAAILGMPALYAAKVLAVLLLVYLVHLIPSHPFLRPSLYAAIALGALAALNNILVILLTMAASTNVLVGLF